MGGRRPSGWIHRSVGAIFCVYLLACERTAVPEPEISAPLRVGVLPDRSLPEVIRNFAPFAQYLQSVVGVKSEVTVVKDYCDLVMGFGAGEYDLALFGAFTFALVRERYQAVPVVMREIDSHFTTLFIAAPDSAADSLEALRGESFAFGPWLSTSGHLMAREHMQAEGLEPESFFSEIRYTFSHEETLTLVREGSVAGGALNSAFLREMFKHGRLSPGDVRLIGETRPYTNYVWTVPEGQGAAVWMRIRDAFMGLSRSIPGHSQVLDGLGANYFLPADASRFDRAAEVAVRLGLEDRCG